MLSNGDVEFLATVRKHFVLCFHSLYVKTLTKFSSKATQAVKAIQQRRLLFSLPSKLFLFSIPSKVEISIL